MNVVSFYQFRDLPSPKAIQKPLQALCDKHGLRGTILVAGEGFNGTLAGSRDAVQSILDWLREELSLEEPIGARWTETTTVPFRRMRVRLKTEIVKLGRPDIRPQETTGKHLPPDQWNELLENPNTVLIDTRNSYEIEVGTFPGAIDPGTDSFRRFPEFAEGLSDTGKDQPIAMFCTGGIRCEKASALMLQLGFTNVNQLQGGVLNYLENISEEQNRWQGECFVFDSRVAVDKDFAEGGYVQCHACRRPLSSYDMKSPDYREGVSCPRCIDELQQDRAVRLEERRRQVAPAAERGSKHIGSRMPDRDKD